MVGRRGIEPLQPKAADLQSAELTTCSTYPRNSPADAVGPRRRADFFSWSRRRDSNPEPAVYKTAALPIELRRRDRGHKPERGTDDDQGGPAEAPNTAGAPRYPPLGGAPGHRPKRARPTEKPREPMTTQGGSSRGTETPARGAPHRRPPTPAVGGAPRPPTEDEGALSPGTGHAYRAGESRRGGRFWSHL